MRGLPTTLFEKAEMNKTLVSIAVMAFAGAASAQSSVTLYGRIDASIASQKTEVGGVTTVDGGSLIRSGAHCVRLAACC